MSFDVILKNMKFYFCNICCVNGEVGIKFFSGLLDEKPVGPTCMLRSSE